ncbi:PilW family protein [Oceanobacillus sp. CAU 1775]
MLKNEKGITLVELLAALVISLFVAGIVYSVVIFSMNYNKVETTKTSLQQEANYIITELQRIHRHNPSYILIVNSNHIKVREYDEDSKEFSGDRTLSDKYTYKLGETETEVILQVFPAGQNKRATNEINILEDIEPDIVIRDVKLSDFTIIDEEVGVDLSVTTVLTRY